MTCPFLYRVKRSVLRVRSVAWWTNHPGPRAEGRNANSIGRCRIICLNVFPGVHNKQYWQTKTNGGRSLFQALASIHFGEAFQDVMMFDQSFGLLAAPSVSKMVGVGARKIRSFLKRFMLLQGPGGSQAILPEPPARLRRAPGPIEDSSGARGPPNVSDGTSQILTASPSTALEPSMASGRGSSVHRSVGPKRRTWCVNGPGISGKREIGGEQFTCPSKAGSPANCQRRGPNETP